MIIDAVRFQCGKQIAGYLGRVPLEDSSGNRSGVQESVLDGADIVSDACFCHRGSLQRDPLNLIPTFNDFSTVFGASPESDSRLST